MMTDLFLTLKLYIYYTSIIIINFFKAYQQVIQTLISIQKKIQTIFFFHKNFLHQQFVSSRFIQAGTYNKITESRVLKMKQMKSLNENQIRKNHTSYLHADDIRNSNKNKFHDVASVIQDAEDSFVSQSELQEFGRQLGLETVVVNEDSFDYHKSKHEGKNFMMEGMSKKNSQVDTILDFSNMMKIRQRGERKSQTEIRTHNILKKFENLHKIFHKIKQQVILDQNQVKKLLIQLKQFVIKFAETSFKDIQNKVKNIRKVDLQQKQQLKRNIQKLKQTIQNLSSENNKLKLQQNNTSQYQIQSCFKNSTELTEVQRQLSLIKERFRMSDLEILSLNKKNTNTSELSTQFEKQSQLIKNQNNEIHELNKQVQQLKQQNKQLKKQILQYENKIQQKQHQSSNKVADVDENRIEIYNRFLQKIEMLEQQIQQMRRTGKSSKNLESDQQIKSKLEQIDEFLLTCDQRQQQLQARERQIIKKQTDIEKRYSRLAQYQEQADDYQLRRHQQNNDNTENYLSRRLPTSPTRKSATLSRNPFFSEKNIKLNKSPQSPRKTQFYSRPSLGYSKGQLDRQAAFQASTRYSDQINCRLTKIQNSIAQQLSSLGYRS